MIKTSKTKERDIADSINIWKRNPQVFVEECIGGKPSNQQEEGLYWVGALAQAKLKRATGAATPGEIELSKKLGISIRSGHGLGKDCFSAWVSWWLLTCFGNEKESPRGRATAPTAPQLRSILWAELRKWMDRSPLLTQIMGYQSERIYLKEKKDTWYFEARTATVKGTLDEQGEALAGMHAPWMMFLIDEASGCPDGVFKPMEGAFTGLMNFALLIGNPTKSTGYFADSHNKYRDFWIPLHWDCEKSNLDTVLCNTGVQDYCERMAKKYGRDSNIYRIRVRGDFPVAESNVLIPYNWIETAIDREITPDENDPKLKGLDVGGGGDKTILLTRKGKLVLSLEEYDEADTMKVVGWAARNLAMDDDYNMAFVDPIGLGAGVYDRLQEMGIPNIEAVDVRRTPDDEDKFFSVRDEIAWRVREDFEKGVISIPNDEEFIGELASIRIDDKKLDSKGLIKVESKKSMRDRGLESPNKFDALALTYFFGDETYKLTTAKQKKTKPDKSLTWKVV